MADEIKVEGTPSDTPEPKQLTEIEQRAHSQGWVPQDEWDGDPEQWRPAKEFLDRGELFKKIDEQNRTIKEFKKTLDEFSRHHAKVKKVEYERALADLKAAKKEALHEGDADAVVDIDEKISMVREAQKEAETAPVQQQSSAPPPEVNILFQNWTERNSWYNNNVAMRAYADRIGNDLGTRGGMSATDILSEVERQVKKEFAHKFQNPNRDKPGSVEGSSSKGGKKADTFSMSEEERRVMRRFVNSGALTEEQYIADLKKLKGV